MVKKHACYLFTLAMVSNQLSAHAGTDSGIKAINKGLKKESAPYSVNDLSPMVEGKGGGPGEPCKRCGSKCCKCFVSGGGGGGAYC